MAQLKDLLVSGPTRLLGPLYANGGLNGSLTGNATTATKLQTSRTISLTGSVTGSGTFDGSGNLSIATTTNHTHSYLPLSGGTMTGAITSSKVTSTHLSGNDGNVIINSTAIAGAYTMLAKLNSTNGYFTDGVYNGTRMFYYTARTTVDSRNNTFTKALTLLDESGNSTFPGKVTASSFTGPLSGNATSADKLKTARTISLTGSVTGSGSFDGSGNLSIATTLATASSTTLGGVKTTSKVTSTTGLTPCPIINGVPYYSSNGGGGGVNYYNLVDVYGNPDSAVDIRAIFNSLPPGLYRYSASETPNITIPAWIGPFAWLVWDSFLFPSGYYNGKLTIKSMSIGIPETSIAIVNDNQYTDWPLMLDSYNMATINANGGGHGTGFKLSCQHNVFGDNRFVLQIEGRTHEVAVDYATNAGNADALGGVAASGYLQTTGGTLSGRLRIANSSPIMTRHIDGDNIDWAGDLYLNYNTQGSNINIFGPVLSNYSSSFNTVYSHNWLRSVGNTGWYNESYQGGIWMCDNDWIRTYNNKNFYCDSIIQGGCIRQSGARTDYTTYQCRNIAAGTSQTPGSDEYFGSSGAIYLQYS